MGVQGMKTFSVLTVSKRTGWTDLACKSVVAQTIAPKSWITVIAEENEELKWSTHWSELKGTTEAYVIKEPPKTKLSNLNASLNAGLKWIDTWHKSDYVIFYQDFIELAEDCFEKLLELATPKTFVTTCTPNYDGSDDGRYTGADMARPCRPEEWEANVAIAPMQILRALGGFDEDYDWGWSWDNVNVAERAAMLGAKFICDESNRPTLYPHEMTSHETLPKNGERHARTMQDIRDGKKPLKLPYL